MGFYVDLEMPKDCPMCPFANYDMFNTFSGCDITSGKRWAVKNDKDYAESSTRPDWCPLIEVPEPHGDLIGRDALLKKCEFVCTDDDEDIRAVRYSIIENAPTVIPASEDGKT